MKSFSLALAAFLISSLSQASYPGLPANYGPGGKTASDFVIDHFSGNRQRPPSTVDYGCNWNFRLKRCMPAGYPSR
ncbi:MAG: hypothetical protein EOP11_15285 [Proteobacteria bacterium]|nr:MAG: hypothetical protein EOP11_15285 [Pseudomonadota bacterium]